MRGMDMTKTCKKRNKKNMNAKKGNLKNTILLDTGKGNGPHTGNQEKLLKGGKLGFCSAWCQAGDCLQRKEVPDVSYVTDRSD